MPGIPALDQLEESFVRAIAAEQVGRRQRRRRSQRLAVVAAVTAAAAVGAGVLAVPSPEPADDLSAITAAFRPPTAEAAVEVRQAPGVHVVTIDNVASDTEGVRRRLRELGLPVSVRFVAASPSLVGDLVALSEAVPGQGLEVDYEQAGLAEHDAVSIRVPLAYRGEAELTVGRRALPGELYETSAQLASEPGEELHCVDLVEGPARVRDVLPEIQRRGVEVVWRDERDETVRSGATPLAAGHVLISVRSDRGEQQLTPEYLARLRAGCPSRPA